MYVTWIIVCFLYGYVSVSYMQLLHIIILLFINLSFFHLMFLVAYSTDDIFYTWAHGDDSVEVTSVTMTQFEMMEIKVSNSTLHRNQGKSILIVT